MSFFLPRIHVGVHRVEKEGSWNGSADKLDTIPSHAPEQTHSSRLESYHPFTARRDHFTLQATQTGVTCPPCRALLFLQPCKLCQRGFCFPCYGRTWLL